LRTLRAGVRYFALVFAAGFVLGPIRITFLEPRLGVRFAELLEIPVMITVVFLSARWVVRRCAVPPVWSARLGMGFLALILMLSAEFGLVLRLRGLSPSEYLATRDPVSGTAYYLSLALFAAMPWMVRRSLSPPGRSVGKSQ